MHACSDVMYDVIGQDVIRKRREAADLATREDMLSLFMSRTDADGNAFVCYAWM
jgi:hypothetical protein